MSIKKIFDGIARKIIGKRIVVFGESGSGKTTLHTFLRESRFSKSYTVTTGLENLKSTTFYRNNARLHLKKSVDINGDKQYSKYWEFLIKENKICFFIFDTSKILRGDKESINYISEFLPYASKLAKKHNTKLLLIGNFTDKIHNFGQTRQEIKNRLRPNLVNALDDSDINYGSIIFGNMSSKEGMYELIDNILNRIKKPIKKTIILLSVVAFIIATIFAGIFVFKKYNEEKNITNLVNFKFDNSAELLFNIKEKNDLFQIKKILSDFDIEILQAFPQVKDIEITELDDVYTIDVTKVDIIPIIIKRLNKSGLIDWIEDNDTYSLSPIEMKNTMNNLNPSNFNSLYTNDPHKTKLWGLSRMNVNKFYFLLKNITPKKRAKIFILDTGVDSKHPDLQNNYISINPDFDIDTDKHGTHCAGIACAVSNNNVGIASLNLSNNFTSITSITVLPEGSGTDESIIDGIILAADNGADVISMSLGGQANGQNPAYNEAIRYANKKGAIIIVAAGNENQNTNNVIPASCKGVIVVSAIDQNMNRASFSNFFTDIKYGISAPGVNIYSTTPNNHYEYLNGTSMATPYVAGLVGIMKSINPNLNTKEIYNILNTTGINTKNTLETGKFIQPEKAILALDIKNKKSFLQRILDFFT